MATPALTGDARDQQSYRLGFALLALAGWVDAIAFMHWHMFVSFMSGTTTQLAVAGAQAQGVSAMGGLEVVGIFVAGVISGELLRASSGRRYQTAVLAVEAACLAIAALLSFKADGVAVLRLLSFAMGLQNAVLHRVDRADIALTYVTGTLVHLGRALATALAGKGSWSAAFHYIRLWMALALGALAGGFAAHWNGSLAILIAFCFIAMLALISAFDPLKS